MIIYLHLKMPELKEMGTEIELNEINENESNTFLFKIKVQNIVNQNVGILLGAGLMFILALYSKYLEFLKSYSLFNRSVLAN